MSKSPDDKKLEETEVQIQKHGPTQLVSVKEGEPCLAPQQEETANDSMGKALKEAEDNRNRWLRAAADLENFKKRSSVEKSRLLKYKEEDLLKDLLPILDNLERALTHGGGKDQNDPVAVGVLMVMEMFKEVLKKYEVTQIESIGKKFDPQVHEAIGQEPGKDNDPNTISRELEKGYMYKDRLLRPAKVIVYSTVK